MNQPSPPLPPNRAKSIDLEKIPLYVSLVGGGASRQPTKKGFLFNGGRRGGGGQE